MNHISDHHYKALYSDIKMNFDSGDSWGSAMSLLSSICDILYYRSDNIPNIWEFHPGALSGKELDTDDFNTELLNEYPSACLVKLGTRLNRLVIYLDNKGLSY